MQDRQREGNGFELNMAIVLFVIAAIVAIIAVTSSDAAKGTPATLSRAGEYEIVTLVEVGEDHALAVLRDTKGELRYYRIPSERTLNFEDAAKASRVISVNRDGLRYIEFITEFIP